MNLKGNCIHILFWKPLLNVARKTAPPFSRGRFTQKIETASQNVSDDRAPWVVPGSRLPAPEAFGGCLDNNERVRLR